MEFLEGWGDVGGVHEVGTVGEFDKRNAVFCPGFLAVGGYAGCSDSVSNFWKRDPLRLVRNVLVIQDEASLPNICRPRPTASFARQVVEDKFVGHSDRSLLGPRC